MEPGLMPYFNKDMYIVAAAKMENHKYDEEEE